MKMKTERDAVAAGQYDVLEGIAKGYVEEIYCAYKTVEERKIFLRLLRSLESWLPEDDNEV